MTSGHGPEGVRDASRITMRRTERRRIPEVDPSGGVLDVVRRGGAMRHASRYNALGVVEYLGQARGGRRCITHRLNTAGAAQRRVEATQLFQTSTDQKLLSTPISRRRRRSFWSTPSEAKPGIPGIPPPPHLPTCRFCPPPPLLVACPRRQSSPQRVAASTSPLRARCLGRGNPSATAARLEARRRLSSAVLHAAR